MIFQTEILRERSHHARVDIQGLLGMNDSPGRSAPQPPRTTANSDIEPWWKPQATGYGRWIKWKIHLQQPDGRGYPGYPPEDIIGKTPLISCLLMSQKAGAGLPRIRRRTKTVFTFGKYQPAQVRPSVVLETSACRLLMKRASSWVQGIDRDVTNRKKLEEELGKAARPWRRKSNERPWKSRQKKPPCSKRSTFASKSKPNWRRARINSDPWWKPERGLGIVDAEGRFTYVNGNY